MPRTRERSASPGRPPPIEAPPDAEQSMGSRLDAHQVARLTKTPLSRTPKTPTSKTPTKHDGTSKTPQRTPTKHSGDRTPTKHSGDARSPLEKAGIESSVKAFSLSPAPSLYVATDFSTMSLEDASNLSFTESGMLGTAASDSAKNKVLQQMDLQGVEVYDLRALNAEIHEELHPSPEKPSPSKPSPLKTPDSTTYSPSRFTTAAVSSPSRFTLGSTAQQKREILDAEAHRVSEAARAELHMRNQAPLPTDLSDVANVVGWVERHVTRGGSPPAHRIRRVEDADPAAAEDAAEAEAVAAGRRRDSLTAAAASSETLWDLQARMLVEAEHAVGQRREVIAKRAQARAAAAGASGAQVLGAGGSLEAEARLRAQFADGADVRLASVAAERMKEETAERARKIKQLRQARKYAKHECAEVEKRMRVALGRKPYPAELMDDETFATAIVRYREIVAELQVLEVDFER